MILVCCFRVSAIFFRFGNRVRPISLDELGCFHFISVLWNILTSRGIIYSQKLKGLPIKPSGSDYFGECCSVTIFPISSVFLVCSYLLPVFETPTAIIFFLVKKRAYFKISKHKIMNVVSQSFFFAFVIKSFFSFLKLCFSFSSFSLFQIYAFPLPFRQITSPKMNLAVIILLISAVVYNSPAPHLFALEPKVRDKQPPGGSSYSNGRNRRGKEENVQRLLADSMKVAHVTSICVPLAKAVTQSSLKLLGREIHSIQDETMAKVQTQGWLKN